MHHNEQAKLTILLIILIRIHNVMVIPGRIFMISADFWVKKAFFFTSRTACHRKTKKIRGETASSQLAVLIVKKSLPSWHATIIAQIFAFTMAKLILVFTTTNINVDTL